jgi:hypothetical protein
MHKRFQMLRRGFAAGLASSLLLLAGQANATTIIRQTLDEMVTQVDRIVVGEVVTTDAAWNLANADGDVVYTTATLHVEQSLKGRDNPEYIQLFGPGGRLDGVETMVPGAPAFGESGQRMIVFLWDGVEGQYESNVAYWGQGQYLVNEQGIVERTGQSEAEFIRHIENRIAHLSE